MRQLCGAHIVVLGLGGIGREVVRLCTAFGASVTGVRLRAEDLSATMAAGVVVYLRAQPETFAARIGRGEGRPWLDDQLPTLWQMLADRDPTFRAPIMSWTPIPANRAQSRGRS
jgi:shikimate kinase